MFRHRPAELFFCLAEEKNIGIIVRVPLASGLLTGKTTPQTTLAPDDHRTFNREGEAFDKGETFVSVDFELGLEAVEKLKELFSEHPGLPLWAPRWILMFKEVSCVIPGASRMAHVRANVKASGMPPLTKEQMAGVKEIYREYIKGSVHQR